MTLPNSPNNSELNTNPSKVYNEDGSFSNEFKVKRFFSKYREVVSSGPFNVKDFRSIYDLLTTELDKHQQPTQSATNPPSVQQPKVPRILSVTYQGDNLHYIVMSLLLKLGEYKNLMFINGYKLIDIFLGNDVDEEDKSVTSIETDIVCCYLGYGEMPNKQQETLLHQVLEQQRLTKKYFWLMLKGRPTEARYPQLMESISTYGPTVFIKDNSIKSGIKETRTNLMEEI